MEVWARGVEGRDGGKEGRRRRRVGWNQRKVKGRRGNMKRVSVPLRLTRRVELVIRIRGSTVRGLIQGTRRRDRRRRGERGGRKGKGKMEREREKDAVSGRLSRSRNNEEAVPLTLIPASRSRDMAERRGETEGGRGGEGRGKEEEEGMDV